MLKKKFIFISFFIISLFMCNAKVDAEKEFKTYEECVKSRDCNSQKNGSAKTACQNSCKSATGSTSGINNSDVSNIINTSSSSKCSYKVNCADVAKKFPNRSVHESKTTEILTEYIADSSKISIIIDGTTATQFPEKTGDGYNVTAGKFCGYDFNNSVYTGLDVTYLINDKDFITNLSKGGNCPKLSIFDGTGFYLSSSDYLSKLGSDVDTYDITGTREESTISSSSKKVLCYYKCSEFNGDETISIMKNEDNSFELKANYLETYKSDWYSKLNWNSSSDCSSTIYKNGDVNSYYYDSSKLNNATVSCKKIKESEYYSPVDAPEAEGEDNLTAICGILTPNSQKFIYEILDWIKYIGLILAVVLGVLDFMRAMASSEDDAFKKAGSKFAKRIIAVIILFLIPVLLKFILTLVKIQGVNPSNPLCQ